MNYEETRPTTTRFKVQNKITVYKIKHFRKNKKMKYKQKHTKIERP
jgi:hypothetical protein